MISLQSTKEGYKVKPRMEKVTVCFKKSNGYLQKVVNCHMYACAFCCPPPLAPPPWRLVWRDHVSLAEVRHAEDNMTPRSHLRSLLIFDRSLNRYFGAKRDNGACRSAIRLSSFFFFLNSNMCHAFLIVCNRGKFSAPSYYLQLDPVWFLCAVKGNSSHWALWNK